MFSDFLDWGVDDIDAEIVFGGYDGATNIGGNYTGYGINIAILDSGIDKQTGYLHWEFVNKIAGEYDFYYGDSNAEDGLGHGIRCAGIAGAKDNNLGIIGVAPECEFLIARIANQYELLVDATTLGQAINWSVSNGADIISMSWGFYEDPGDTFYNSLRYAYDSGVVLVAGAGNDDTDISYPAIYSEVISVGAISKDHTRAGYPDSGWASGKASNYGSNLDVVAPGTAIYSSWLNNDYYNISGTSMACPHVAGLCALILEAQSLLTPSQVKDVLRMTATDLGPSGKDDYYGYGEVNATKAIDAAELYFTDSDGDDLTD